MPSIHTRASRACFTCRNRKVRCNVALAGIPCSSCSSAGLKCSINPTKRSSLKSSAKERRSIPIGLHVFDVHMKSPNDQSSREADPESQSESQEDVTSRIDNFLTTAPEALDLDLVKALSATISECSNFLACNQANAQQVTKPQFRAQKLFSGHRFRNI